MFHARERLICWAWFVIALMKVCRRFIIFVARGNATALLLRVCLWYKYPLNILFVHLSINFLSRMSASFWNFMAGQKLSVYFIVFPTHCILSRLVRPARSMLECFAPIALPCNGEHRCLIKISREHYAREKTCRKMRSNKNWNWIIKRTRTARLGRHFKSRNTSLNSFLVFTEITKISLYDSFSFHGFI